MSDFTFTDEQVRLAKSILEQAETMYYANHDQDELEAHAVELGLDLDLLPKVNKTSLKKANRTQAERVVEVSKDERNLAYARREFEGYAAKVMRSIEALETKLRERLESMAKAENLLHMSGYWEVDHVMHSRAELQVLYLVRSILFNTEDRGATWTRSDATPVHVQKKLQRDLLWATRNAASQSTSVLSTYQDRLELEHKAKLIDELEYTLQAAARYGLLDTEEEA